MPSHPVTRDYEHKDYTYFDLGEIAAMSYPPHESMGPT
jgi:hypothetical protein